MRVTLEPTAEFFRTDEGYPVRAWRGTTDRGTPVVAFIAAVTCEPEHAAEFEVELRAIPGPNVARVRVREASDADPG